MIYFWRKRISNFHYYKVVHFKHIFNHICLFPHNILVEKSNYSDWRYRLFCKFFALIAKLLSRKVLVIILIPWKDVLCKRSVLIHAAWAKMTGHHHFPCVQKAMVAMNMLSVSEGFFQLQMWNEASGYTSLFVSLL